MARLSPITIGILVLVLVLVFMYIVPRERFVVTGPSKTGDQKEVTPSGNVILY